MEILGRLVGDTISCRDENFLKLIRRTEKRFEMKQKDLLKLTFGTVLIRKIEDGIIVHHSDYAATLTELLSDASLKHLRAAKQKIAWISITGPDVCAMTNVASQVTNETFDKKRIKGINKLIKRISKSRERDSGSQPRREISQNCCCKLCLIRQQYGHDVTARAHNSSH